MVLPSLSKIDHQKAQGALDIYMCKSFKVDPIDVIFVKIPHHQPWPNKQHSATQILGSADDSIMVETNTWPSEV